VPSGINGLTGSSWIACLSAAPVPWLRSMMLLQERQVMLLLPVSVTSTGAPQLGQLNCLPVSSLADSSFRPLSLRSSSSTDRPSDSAGVPPAAAP
jgi:hypothetical protein